MPEHGRLKEMFQCMFATEERPQALLTENSGASHGQNSRSTGQPRRDETVGSGTEKRSGWWCSSLYRLFLHRRCYPLCKTRTTCPKKRPVEGHSYWFSRWGVCHVPMRWVCLERPWRHQRGEWRRRGRKSTTRPMVGVHAGREFLAASKAARRLGEPGVQDGLLEPRR